MRSLIIEDDYSSASVFRAYFNQYGFCESVTNGLGGYELYLNSLITGNPYNLIIIDIILPDINGYEVLKKIRFEENVRNVAAFNRAKIILTTSLDDEENKKIAEELNEENEAYYVKSPGLYGLGDVLFKLGFTTLYS